MTVALDDLAGAQSAVLAWLAGLPASVPDLTGQLDGTWVRQVTVTAEWSHVRLGQ
jgi:hypothetical protein